MMSLLPQLTGRFLKGLKPSPISKDDAKIVDCSVFFVCGITFELARVLLWKYPMFSERIHGEAMRELAAQNTRAVYQSSHVSPLFPIEVEVAAIPAVP